MFDSTTLNHIKNLWEFNQLHQALKPADLLLVLGSNDLLVPKRAAEVYNQKLANCIMTSGGFGRLSKSTTKSEAEIFKSEIVKQGVPENLIYIENKSTNTGENIQFSYKLILENNLKHDRIILVTKTYMEKRAWATFKKQWPDQNTQIQITSPNISFDKFLKTPDIQDAINIMVGDTQRIKIYPAKGFMIETEIPETVWSSFEYLVKYGFNTQVLN